MNYAETEKSLNSNITKVNVLGVAIDPVTVAELHHRIEHLIAENAHALIIHVNVYGLNLAYKRSWLRDFYNNNAAITVCDGVGPILGARMLGENIPERITYADWIWQLAALAEEKEYSMFFLGGHEGVAENAAKHLREKFPKLKIVGTHHGYFNKQVDCAENLRIIQMINNAKPNLLFVGFGMPRQEKWLLENWDRINANIGLGPGALFGYISGDVARAPRWMTENGLEWLGRFLVEPRRLWQRYLLGNPLFLWRVIKQRLGFCRKDNL